jgi:hypothetical protein
MTESFIPPEFWSFPPFFTFGTLSHFFDFLLTRFFDLSFLILSRIQPVQITRQKQLDLWKDLLLEYHMKRNIHSMTLAEFPYFENQTINRKLNREGILAVIQHMIDSGKKLLKCNWPPNHLPCLSQIWLGNAEWQDGNLSRVRIIWRTPEALAADIYSWARSNMYIGNIFTIYELLNNEDYSDSGSIPPPSPSI